MDTGGEYNSFTILGYPRIETSSLIFKSEPPEGEPGSARGHDRRKLDPQARFILIGYVIGRARVLIRPGEPGCLVAGSTLQGRSVFGQQRQRRTL